MASVPLFEIGNRNLISRTVEIERGETITLFDVNIDIQQGWQLVFQFTGDSQQGEIEIETFTNISSFVQKLDWSSHVGDFITGKGSFRVRVNNQAAAPGPPSTINAYVTTENFLDDVASFTESSNTTSAVIGTFGDVGEFQGHIPFPYNSWSIFTSSPIDVRYVDDAGGVIATYPAVAIGDAFLRRQFMPKRLSLQVAGTVVSQLYTIQWSRK